jgi:molybdopterin synthase catalytic subunit
MTEKKLQDIVAQAESRWPLLGARIIHRIGELHPGDQIVMVATASSHRHAAFEAAEFIMDYLKSHAPFWKKQSSATSSDWISSRSSDGEALKRWQD